MSTKKPLPFTPRLSIAIEAARVRADNLGHSFVGTEHMLLGILGSDGFAAKYLESKGVTLEGVTEMIEKHYAPTDPRLLAAAPDLLEALEAMTHSQREHGHVPMHMVATAHAAIKKARGE